MKKARETRNNFRHRHGLTIEVLCRNQPNKSKVALNKPLLHFYSNLKQLYTSNKKERFSYKDGCGICGHTRIEVIKKSRLGL